MSKSVCAEQAKQKNNHDHHCQSREYFVGQNVQAHNFREGPRWVAGVIVERLGPLTYLVQVNTGVFWRRHVDHLRTAHDRPPDQDKTVPPNSSLSPDFPTTPSDFIPIVNSEQPQVVEQRSQQSVTERRYPRRLNRRPPDRYRS